LAKARDRIVRMGGKSYIDAQVRYVLVG
jgi:hypothetical protein